MIVDGGLGSELERRGFAYSTTLWSGEAVLRRPDLVSEIHRAYLAAGAEMIATATYQLSHAALRELGHDDAAVDAVFAQAVRLARDSVAAHTAGAETAAVYHVAGSLGPFGATLGDGSEYSGVQHLERDALYAFHAERTRSMARAKPDLFLFETISSWAEGRVIAEVARDLGLERVWMSFSCADGAHTYGGDRLDRIAAELDAFAGIDVVGVNCTAPGIIAPLVGALRSATAKPIVVCPNLGGASEAEFVDLVPDWLDLGVAHIGGCCGVGPETIAAIAQAEAQARPAT